jgi:hypothetical protein
MIITRVTVTVALITAALKRVGFARKSSPTCFFPYVQAFVETGCGGGRTATTEIISLVMVAQTVVLTKDLVVTRRTHFGVMTYAALAVLMAWWMLMSRKNVTMATL